MKNSLRGAFWSGLLFPGLGQIILKRYARGIILMLAVFGCMAVIVAKAVQLATAILEKIELQGGTIDLDAIVDTTVRVSATADNRLINVMMWLIVFCWIFGIVDAYRIGRKKDSKEQEIPLVRQ